MSYIESIKKNISDAIEIKKIARSKNVNYAIAKILYHNGKKDIDLETAKKLAEIFEKNKIPLNLIDTFDLISVCNQSYNKSYSSVCAEISKHIVSSIDSKYFDTMEPFMNYRFHYLYGRKILDLMKKGISLNSAVKMFETRVNLEKKKYNLSDIAALIKILYYGSNKSAKIFEKACQINSPLLNGSYLELIQRMILNNLSEFKKKNVNGISIVSETEEGLQKLESLIKEAYKQGNQDFLKKLSFEASQCELMVTDFSLHNDNDNSAFYSGDFHYIFMDKNSLSSPGKLSVFFHEATHFLDNRLGMQEKNMKFGAYFSYDVNSSIIEELLEKIKSKVKIISRGLSMGYQTNLNADKYINNPILNKKWLQQVRDENIFSSGEDIQLYFQQKKIYERKKYLILDGYIMDIYDGLTNGTLHTFAGIPGHGQKYYKEFANILEEFIANIGAFYNSGGIDILNYEFGEELTTEIIRMYKNFISFNQTPTSSVIVR